jgi:uncharacterized pyridoxamine 5'-phosphate oxidase family protein
MNQIVNALKKNGVFFVGTVDENGQPQVRPFSSVAEINGDLYICTNNTKDVYHQLQNNPKVALTSMGKDGTWIRVTGTAVRDDNDASRQAMLDDPTGPSNLYKIGDGIFEVLRIENAHAVQYSMTADPVEIKA